MSLPEEGFLGFGRAEGKIFQQSRAENSIRIPSHQCF